MKLIEFWLAHRSEFLSACLQHLALVVISTGIAVAIGIPLLHGAGGRPGFGRHAVVVVATAVTLSTGALVLSRFARRRGSKCG